MQQQRKVRVARARRSMHSMPAAATRQPWKLRAGLDPLAHPDPNPQYPPPVRPVVMVSGEALKRAPPALVLPRPLLLRFWVLPPSPAPPAGPMAGAGSRDMKGADQGAASGLRRPGLDGTIGRLLPLRPGEPAGGGGERNCVSSRVVTACRAVRLASCGVHGGGGALHHRQSCRHILQCAVRAHRLPPGTPPGEGGPFCTGPP